MILSFVCTRKNNATVWQVISMMKIMMLKMNDLLSRVKSFLCSSITRSLIRMSTICMAIDKMWKEFVLFCFDWTLSVLFTPFWHIINSVYETSIDNDRLVDEKNNSLTIRWYPLRQIRSITCWAYHFVKKIVNELMIACQQEASIWLPSALADTTP